MKELEAVYLKRPKAKRVSYEKNHVLSPFGPQWNLLFNQEVNTSDAATNSRLQMCVLRGGNYMEPFNFYERSAPILPMSMPTLVRAYVSFPRKGNKTETSNVTLYLPRKQDVEAFHRSLKWQGVSGTNVHDVFNTNLLGFVTSAVYDKPKSNFRIMAFCGCDQLQRLIQEQQEILMSGTGMNLPMALCRNGSSTFYRPVFLEVLS
jgi:hypothetical protein